MVHHRPILRGPRMISHNRIKGILRGAAASVSLASRESPWSVKRVHWKSAHAFFMSSNLAPTPFSAIIVVSLPLSLSLLVIHLSVCSRYVLSMQARDGGGGGGECTWSQIRWQQKSVRAFFNIFRPRQDRCGRSHWRRSSFGVTIYLGHHWLRALHE